jgi:hypothetical protein
MAAFLQRCRCNSRLKEWIYMYKYIIIYISKSQSYVPQITDNIFSQVNFTESNLKKLFFLFSVLAHCHHKNDKRQKDVAFFVRSITKTISNHFK